LKTWEGGKWIKNKKISEKTHPHRQNHKEGLQTKTKFRGQQGKRNSIWGGRELREKERNLGGNYKNKNTEKKSKGPDRPAHSGQKGRKSGKRKLGDFKLLTDICKAKKKFVPKRNRVFRVSSVGWMLEVGEGEKCQTKKLCQ